MTEVRETIATQQEVIMDIRCNRCGESCKRYMAKKDNIYNLEFLRLGTCWGYPTPYDGESWTGHLCVECAGEFKKWMQESGGTLDIVCAF